MNNSAKQFEALRREIDDWFRAAQRRSAEYAAAAASELHLDRLAERFRAEAADPEDDDAERKD